MMSEHSKELLNPIERVAEVLFGVIMVLTVTGSVSVAEAGKGEIRSMLLGALGCNLAWGIVDGVFYLMGCLAERGQELRAWRALRGERDPRKGQEILARALPPIVVSVAEPAELEAMRQRLVALPEREAHVGLKGRDWLGAGGVFLFVFLSTFPVVVPFLFMHDVRWALRISNGIGIGMLFLAGYAFGRITGHRPWVRGIAMVVVGLVLVAMTMALGG